MPWRGHGAKFKVTRDAYRIQDNIKKKAENLLNSLLFSTMSNRHE